VIIKETLSVLWKALKFVILSLLVLKLLLRPIGKRVYGYIGLPRQVDKLLARR
jgi:hypothetical protein